jgi:hypothetical protein
MARHSFIDPASIGAPYKLLNIQWLKIEQLLGLDDFFGQSIASGG